MFLSFIIKEDALVCRMLLKKKNNKIRKRIFRQFGVIEM